VLHVAVTRSQGAFTVDASFTTNGTGITALFGRSGAGKTSVINMIAGLLQPNEGTIRINGTTYFDSRAGVDLPPNKRRFGYIFQDGRLFPHLSVKSNLSYGMKLVSPSDRYVKFEPVVELLGIEHLLNRRPAKLSGGEKQRVAIGRALLTSPRLLLMDEPLASLDEERKAEVLPFIARLPMEFSVPILYVSHSMEEILKLADTLVIMESGRAVAVGSTKEVATRFDVGSLGERCETGLPILGRTQA
jgi:molybdate transport system ATP-binding protein